MFAYKTQTATPRARLLAGCAVAAAAIGSPAVGQTAFQATAVSPGTGYSITRSATLDTVSITAPQAVIDWTPTDNATGGGPITVLAAGTELRFTANPSNVTEYTVLNRVIPVDPSRAIQFDGKVTSQVEAGYGGPGPTAGGNIWFYSPGGIILGGTARFDVGSLVLTANDILLNGDGGLFEFGDTTAQAGNIRFNATPDSKSFVTINAGAQINALGTESNGANSYVALVAPRVKQSGTINSVGSVALIAAETVGLTIPMSGGLFDIFVNQGSKADTPGGTTLEHSGATEINDINGTRGQTGIYMVAVPKNDAVTMLVSGSVGYDAASQVHAANGAIYLSTGIFAFGANVAQASGGKVNVTGGDFTSLTQINAQDVKVDTSTAALNFGSGLDIRATSGKLDITAQDGRNITVAGDLNARHLAGNLDGSSTISVTANAGSTISAKNIGLYTDAFGADEAGYGAIPPLAAKGGQISVSADGGIITAGKLEFKARGFGGSASSNDGASGTGGTISVSANNNGQIVAANSLFLVATGTGGDSSQGSGGNAFGGSAKIVVDTGGKFDLELASLEAAASGGDTGSSANGGAATGGTATISVAAGSFETDQSTTFEVSAGGGESDGVAGNATGGIASLLMGNAGSSAKISGGLYAMANAFGGGSGLPTTGGDAQGGTVAINAGGGALTISLGEGLASRLEAKAASGFGTNRSGDSKGGTVTVDLKGTTASLQNLFANASATVSNQSLADVSDPFADNGGNASGGSATFTFANATVDTFDIGIDVNGQGGFGGASDIDGIPITGTKAGSGTGGKAALTVTGGKLTTNLIVLDARGFGGQNHSVEDVEFSGAGVGGEISLGLSGVDLSPLNKVSLFATGLGGSGDASAGGAGTGGKIAVNVGPTTVLDLVGTLEVIAKGDGGDGFNFGGAAQGGMIDITANGGTIDALYTVDARARGGAAFGGGTAFDQTGKVAGAATGGSITVSSKGGGLIVGTGSFISDGDGGRGFADIAGGNGTGGLIALTATGGTFDFSSGTPTFDAFGIGGDADNADAPTFGRGGAINIQLNAGSGSDPASKFLFGDLFLNANGQIYDRSDGSPEPSNAGIGVGGTVSVAVNDGVFSGGSLDLYADGFGGSGEQGGIGGDGFQGKASFSVSGGSATVSGALRLLAGAFGANGINEDQEGNRNAAKGGAAGVGPNPYGAGAGAYVSLTGGTLTTPTLFMDASSSGGLGGSGDQFTSTPLAGNGGDAIGGIASFTTSGTAGATIGDLTVTAAAFGGDGGEVEYGYGFSGPADGIGGAGGIATGGTATIAITGSGLNAFGRVEAQADGNGGRGGSVTSTDNATLFGAGRGGLSGSGAGGTAIVTVGATLVDDAQLIANANGNGIGTLGGSGPQGGAGGDVSGGVAMIDITGGANSFSEITASAVAFAGDGGDGDSSHGGDGGKAQGGSASIRVSGAGTTASTPVLFVSGSARGGAGGFGGSNFSTGSKGGNGGAGGASSGGEANFDLLDGSISLTGSESLALFRASGTGGSGGDGGSGDADPQGSGGAGGNGTGGSIKVIATGGEAIFDASEFTADGEGGLNGADGGFVVLAGSAGSGTGGNILLGASSSSAVSLDFGATILSADGVSGLGASESGRIEINASAPNPDGAIVFASLDAHARGTDYDVESDSGIFVRATDTPIVVSGSAAFDARGPVNFDFTGTGGLRSPGGLVSVSSFENIFVSHNNAQGPSIDALSIVATADGSIFAAPGSQLKSGSTIALSAFSGTATLSGANAVGDIAVRADGNVTIGSVGAANLLLFAGQADGSSSISSGADASVTGTVTLTGNASINASRDVIVGGGAKITADRLVSITSGDDIVIGAGALVRAANNAPDETGYGASDPLQQASQLKLYAGGISADPVSGNVASILISGDLEAPDRTIQLRAGAIQANGSSQLTGGNLYARIDNAPSGDQVPSTDFGQLSGACLEGSICLDVANIDGIVQIGELGFQPINLRLAGGVDGTDVLLRSLGEIRLGEAGVARSIRGSDSLVIDAGNGNLTLQGPLDIFGGGVTRVQTSSNIVGDQASITALGTLDIYAANNITLGAITADTIRTIDPASPVLTPIVSNPIGITLPGALKVGQIAVTSGALTLDATKGITLGSLSAPGLVTLNSANAITVTSDAAAPSGIIATGSSVALVGANGLNINQATASSGDVMLKTTGGVLAFKSVTASGAVTVDAAGDANGGNIDAASIAFQSAGALNANQFTAKSGTLLASADKGLTLTNLVAAGAVTLKAVAGPLSVSNVVSAPAGITASAASIILRGVSDLNITSATATAGNTLLSTQSGPLFVQAASAAGLLSLAAVGDINVDSGIGGKISVSTSGALIGNKLIANGIFSPAFPFPGTLTVSATDIELDRIAATGAAKLTATAGAVTVNEASSTGGITASGKAITLSGAGGLKVIQATATAGDVTLTTGFAAVAAGIPLQAGTVLASGKIVIAGKGAVTFTKLTATGPVTISGDDISGGEAQGSTIAVTADGAFSGLKLTSNSGAIDASATDGITLDSIASAGAATLKALNGAVKVTTDTISTNGVVASGQSVSLGGLNGLKVAQAIATAGDVTLTAFGGPLNVQDAQASGGIALNSAATLDFATLTAGGLLTIDAAGDITGGSAKAASIDISGSSAINATSLSAASGDVLVATQGDLAIDFVSTPGLARLQSGKGLAQVTTDLSAASAFVSGTKVSLSGKNGLKAIQAFASNGDILLDTVAGQLDVDTAQATGTISLLGGGGVTFNALKAGTDIAVLATGDVTGGSVTGGSLMLKATGAAKIADIASSTGVTATALSLDLTGANGLSIANANATGGDVTLTSLAGTLDAGTSAATAAIGIKGAGPVTFTSLTAGGAIGIDAQGDVTGGSATAASIAFQSAGAVVANQFTAKSGTLLASADKGLTLTNLVAAGAVTLKAVAGPLSVSNVVSAPAGITASAASIILRGVSDLNITSATATAGDALLSTQSGPLFVQAASAAGLLSLAAVGDINVDSGIGGKISVSTSGALIGNKLIANGIFSPAFPFPGTLTVSATDIELDRIAATGAAKLTATAGAVTVSDASVTDGITASGETIKLGAFAGLNVTQATATDGDVMLSSGFVASAAGIPPGPLAAGTVQASGKITVAGAGLVTFTNLNAIGPVSITGLGDVTGGEARGSSITLATNGAFSGVKLTSNSGAIDVSANNGVTLDRLASAGAATLKALNGAIKVTTDTISTNGVVASGQSVSLGGLNGLKVAQAIATAGDVTLTAFGGPLNVQDAQASGGIALNSATTVDFANVIAGGLLTIDAAGDITGGSAKAASIDISGSSAINATSLSATSGDVLVATQGDLAIDFVSTPGLAQLQSAKGLAQVTTDLSAASAFVSGTEVSLSGKNGLKAIQAFASNGDVLLDTVAGQLDVDTAQATGTISLLGGGGVTFNALKAGTDIAVLATGDVTGGSVTGGSLMLKATGAAKIADIASSTGVTATALSLDLTGANGLSIANANATGGDVTLTSLAGTLDAGTSAATAAIGIKGAGPVTFTSLTAGGAIGIDAQGDVTGGSATAASIAITTPGMVKANNLVALNGALSAIATKGITLDTAISSGTTTLKSDQGTVTVLSDVKPAAGLIVNAPSINLTGQNGLNIAEAKATAGDLALNTVAGALIAGNSTATGAITLNGATTVDFTSLTAQQGVTIKAGGNITGGSATGTTIAITTPGALNAASLTATAGAVNIDAASGISLASIAATGPVTLGASAGAIKVATDLATSGPIQVTAQSISLNALGNLNLTKAIASADLSVTSGGTITVGSALGATIALTSKDIVIGGGSQLGSASQTIALTLTSTADRTFIGASDSTTGYRLDNDELARIATKGDVRIVSAPVSQTSNAFGLIDPDGANIVIGSMTFDGAQLGSNNSFTIVSPRSIGVVGNLQFKNFQAGQTVTFESLGDVSLAVETGLVTLKDSQGGLAGTLRLQAQQVHAMSTAARSEVENLTLNEAKQRLGTNDQVENDGGYFQAGNIVVRIGRLVFIQNSGANGSDPNLSRGFTANTLTLEAIGEDPAQAIINGRVGTAVGGDLITKTTLIGDFDPNSGFNGCSSFGGACGTTDIALPVFAAVRDQIESEEEEDEKEEALTASQTRPDPVIQIVGAPTSRFDPLIDEPITGAGNEDLWEQPSQTP